MDTIYATGGEKQRGKVKFEHLVKRNWKVILDFFGTSGSAEDCHIEQYDSLTI